MRTSLSPKPDGTKAANMSSRCMTLTTLTERFIWAAVCVLKCACTSTGNLPVLFFMPSLDACELRTPTNHRKQQKTTMAGDEHNGRPVATPNRHAMPQGRWQWLEVGCENLYTNQLQYVPNADRHSRQDVQRRHQKRLNANYQGANRRWRPLRRLRPWRPQSFRCTANPLDPQ